MERRLLGVLLGATIMLMPSSVYATAYSGWTKYVTLQLPGYPNTTWCAQSGILNVAINKSHVRTTAGSYCTSPDRTLPSGWHGVKAKGFRDGSFCGETAWYYSYFAATGWWVTSQLCSNPSGAQAFYTEASTAIWNGSSYYYTSCCLKSPSQTY